MTDQERIAKLQAELDALLVEFVSMRSERDVLQRLVYSNMRTLISERKLTHNEMALGIALLRVDLDSARQTMREWYTAYKVTVDERDSWRARAEQAEGELVAARQSRNSAGDARSSARELEDIEQ